MHLTIALSFIILLVIIKERRNTLMSKTKLMLLPLAALALGACAPEAPTDWTEEDKATMVEVLGDGHYLPFMDIPGYNLSVEGDHLILLAKGTQETLDSYSVVLEDAGYTLENESYVLAIEETDEAFNDIVIDLSLEGTIFEIDASVRQTAKFQWTAEDLEAMELTIPGVVLPTLQEFANYDYMAGAYVDETTATGGMFQFIIFLDHNAEGAAIAQQLNSLYQTALLKAFPDLTMGTQYTNGNEYLGHYTSTSDEYTSMDWTATSFYRNNSMGDETYFAIQASTSQFMPWEDPDPKGATDNIEELKALNEDGTAVHEGEEVVLRGTVASINGRNFVLKGRNDLDTSYNDGILVRDLDASITMPEIGTFIRVNATVHASEGLPYLTVSAIELVQEDGQKFYSDLLYVAMEGELADKSLFGLPVSYMGYFVGIDSESPVVQGEAATVSFAADMVYNEDTGEYTWDEEQVLTLYLDPNNTDVSVLINSLNVYALGDVVTITNAMVDYDENGVGRLTAYEGTIVAPYVTLGTTWSKDVVTSLYDSYAGYGTGAAMNPLPETLPDEIANLTGFEYLVMDGAYIDATYGQTGDPRVTVEIHSNDITKENAQTYVDAFVDSLLPIAGGAYWEYSGDRYWLYDADGYSVNNIQIIVKADAGYLYFLYFFI